MKLLDEFIDFFRFCAAKILTAPLKLLCWLQTHSLNPFRKKKKKEPPQAIFAVSSSYALTSSYITYGTGGAAVVGSPMNQPSGKVFYMDFKYPGPEKSINVHILKE